MSTPPVHVDRPEDGSQGSAIVALCVWLQQILEPFVDDPGDLRVEVLASRGAAVMLGIRPAPADVGRVIGAHGVVINALMALTTAYGHRHRLQVLVEVQDSSSGQRGT